MLIIDHSQVGSSLGAYYYFRDQTGVESHFSVLGARSGNRDGHIWQFMNTDRMAEANPGANRFANGTGAISIETEDNGDPTTSPGALGSCPASSSCTTNWRERTPTIPRRRCSAPTSSGAKGFGLPHDVRRAEPMDPGTEDLPPGGRYGSSSGRTSCSRRSCVQRRTTCATRTTGGIGTAGAVVAAGAVAGRAGADPVLLAMSIVPRRRVGQASPQGTDGTAAVQAVSGPLSLHTITPKRYVDTRYDGGGPFPPQGATGEFFIFDFGAPDYFDGGVANEVPENALAIAFNLTATGGKSAGNLRAFPANSAVLPRVSNVNWVTGQTVANFATVAAASSTGFAASVAFHNASAGNVHAIVDIFGYFA